MRDDTKDTGNVSTKVREDASKSTQRLVTQGWFPD